LVEGAPLWLQNHCGLEVTFGVAPPRRLLLPLPLPVELPPRLPACRISVISCRRRKMAWWAVLK
jgi:hypothetical protein